LVFLVRRQSEAEVAAYFRDEYISEPRKLTREYGIWRDAALNQEAALVQTRKRGGRILDIGCAGGAFLEHFPAGAWERHGVEPSLLAAEKARSRGIQVYNSTLQRAHVTATFDVVTYLDALYFCCTPFEDLRVIHALLADDGLVLIEIPSFAYWAVRNYGPISFVINGRWCNFDSKSRKLLYFSDTALGVLLSRAGFCVEKCVPVPGPATGGFAARAVKGLLYGLARALYGISGTGAGLAPKSAYVCRKKH
jgi:SAM-dependent methyltransferase